MGWVTVRAKPTATAASTALPPLRIISSPASAAKGSAATTIPRVPRAVVGWPEAARALGGVANAPTSNASRAGLRVKRIRKKRL
jgi:hypothetical protein